MLNRLWCNLYGLFPQATSIQLMDQMRILYPVGRCFIPRFLLGSYIPNAGPSSWKFRYWIIKLHGMFKPKEVERNKTATLDTMVPVLHDLHKVTWLNEQKSMRILCDVNLEVEIIQCNEQKSAGVQNNNWSFHIFKKMLSEHLFEKNFINKFPCRVTISYRAIPSIPCWQYVFQSVVPRIFCGSKIHDGRLPRPSCTAPACRGWTWQVTKIPYFREYFSRECSFQPWIFRGHVSFQKSNPMEEVLKLHSVENVTPWMCPFEKKCHLRSIFKGISCIYPPKPGCQSPPGFLHCY